jgi:hypothetical protein
MLHAPFPVAKTLVEKLGNVISTFEEDSEYIIPTLQEMDELVKKVQQKHEQDN